MATTEMFCTECQRVTYVTDGERLECPVCSSPLLTTVEEEVVDPDAPESNKDLDRAAG
ncbi:MAG: hypothetical protein ACRDLB_08500 [Actinomycetota bacterium]